MISAVDFLKACSDGSLTAADYAESCLAEIDRTDSQILAWQHLDTDQIRTDAAQADTASADLALRGVPVGIKDIIDTSDAPCEYGSAACTGRRPDADAELVTLLRQAGAVIMGKTVTTEFAYLEKSRTRNPHNPAFSPGGSSSGSAAAVAADHVPLAIGTQTGGSVIRPASYCQVHAFKPTNTAIDKTGVLQTSETLDQVGFFARSVEDLVLLSSVLVGTSPELPALSSAPRLLMWDGLYGDVVEGYVHDGLARIADGLGAGVEVRPAPAEQIARFQAAHKLIYDVEIGRNLGPVAEAHPDKVSVFVRDVVSRGQTISSADYDQALLIREEARAYMEAVFSDYDGLLTASATGQAPLFENGTGNPACNTLWSLCGSPCLSLPLSDEHRITGPDGLGVGLQLIGGVGGDEKILQTGLWLDAQLA